jgi:competence ComEA-like helix-hairpin-helix protein
MNRLYNNLVYLISSFYGISRGEAIGFTILIPLIFILISVPMWYKPLRMTFIAPDPVDSAAFEIWRDQLKLKLEAKDERLRLKGGSRSVTTPSTFMTFNFDPNTIDKVDLIKLGFDELLADRLIKYRLKGGKFKTGEDLKKMYGMPTELYERIRPFVIIEKEGSKIEIGSSAKQDPSDYKSKPFEPYAFKKAKIPVLEINEADTVDFERLYGIGKVLASRIIRYRNALGGFVSISQVSEVYGLEGHLVDSIGKYFVVSETKVRQIEINLATEIVLESHPYLSKKQAAAIVAYRIQNGEFATFDQLKKVKMVGDSTFKKILPYLKIE